MNNAYNKMLTEYGDTLENTSKDTNAEKNQNGKDIFMTSCKKRVVNFDKYKENFANNLGISYPKSCDAFCVCKNKYFLIEFKNGIIDNVKSYEIREKILHSLLLLTNEAKKTIDFTRENVDFILVYDDTLNHTAKNSVAKSLGKLAKGKFFPFGLDGLEKLYFKEVSAYSKLEFEEKITANL